MLLKDKLDKLISSYEVTDTLLITHYSQKPFIIPIFKSNIGQNGPLKQLLSFQKNYLDIVITYLIKKKEDYSLEGGFSLNADILGTSLLSIQHISKKKKKKKGELLADRINKDDREERMGRR